MKSPLFLGPNSMNSPFFPCEITSFSPENPPQNVQIPSAPPCGAAAVLETSPLRPRATRGWSKLTWDDLLWEKWDEKMGFYPWDDPWDDPILIYFTGKIKMKNEHELMNQPINMWFPLLGTSAEINEKIARKKWDYPIPIHFIRRFSQFSLRFFEPPFTQISPCSMTLSDCPGKRPASSWSMPSWICKSRTPTELDLAPGTRIALSSRSSIEFWEYVGCF